MDLYFALAASFDSFSYLIKSMNTPYDVADQLNAAAKSIQLFYNPFFFSKKGTMISYQSRFVVPPYLRASVHLFLVNASL